MARVPAERPRLPALLALPSVSGVMLRRLPSEPRLLLLVLVVCASAFILTATPRHLERVSDEGIRDAVASVPAHQSSLRVVIHDRLGVSSSGDSFTDLHARGEAYYAKLPEPVHSVLKFQNYVAESPDLELIDGTGNPLYASLLQYVYLSTRYQGGVWQHVTLTDGRMPQPRPDVLPSEALGVEVESDFPASLIEIVITPATAEAMHARIGDRFLVTPTFRSAFLTGPSLDPGASRQRVVLEVVGLIAVNDPGEPYWLGDTKLLHPDRSQAGEQVFSFGAVLVAEDEEVYADLNRATLGSSANPRNWRYSWNFPATPHAFDSHVAADLARDLRRIASTRGPIDELARDPDEVHIAGNLPAIVDRYAAQQRVFASTLALAAAGLLALSLTLSALLSILVVERRRTTIALLRGRGASSGQLVASQLIESALIVLPPMALGLLLALTLVDARARTLSQAIALVLAVAVALLLTGTLYLRLARPPLQQVERVGSRGERRSAPRFVIEGSVVILALAGALLLRRRGIDSGVTEDRSGLLGVDPLLAIAPALLAVAAGLVAARVLPLLARGLARLMARRRGLVPFFALRRIGGSAAGAALPSVALLLAVALSTFGLIVAGSIDSAQRRAALLDTGADFRVESTVPNGSLPPSLEPESIPGVVASARVSVLASVTARTPASTPDRITLVIVEPAEYARVVAGSELDSTYRGQVDVLSGMDGNAAPILVGSLWSGLRDLRSGVAIEATIGSRRVPLVVHGVGDAPPGVSTSAFYAVVSRDSLARADGALPDFSPTQLYLRADDAARASVEAEIAAHGPSTRLIARAEAYERSRESPLTGGVASGFRLTVAICAIFAALSSIAALVLSSHQRGRDLGYLRTLGLTQRQALRLVMAEHIPLVVAAATLGGLLGVVTAWAIEPGFDLGPFAGLPSGQTPLVVDALGIAVVTLVITAVVALATAGFVLLTRRAQLGQLLRVGDE